MAIKLSNATTEQVANYLLLSINTERGLRDAIALLETEKTFSRNSTLTNQMVLKLPKSIQRCIPYQLKDRCL